MVAPHMSNRDLKLTLPTDFEILAYMADGKRHQAQEIAPNIDQSPQYVRNRLGELLGHSLVEKIPDSSMYVITEVGQLVLKHRDDYSHDSRQEFGRLIREKAGSHDS